MKYFSAMFIRLFVVVIIIFSFSSSVNAESGLVGWWKFDEGAGDILHDSSGNGNDGKIYGAKWVKEKNGFALQFDSKSYVDCGNKGSLQIDGPITISTWVKPQPDTTGATVISKEGWILYFDKSRPIFISRDAYNTMGEWIWLHPDRKIPVDEWTYIAVVCSIDRQTMEFYINGKMIHSIVWSDGGIGNFFQYDLNFGRQGLYYKSPTTYFTGLLLETKIYNRDLSAEEIDSNYQYEKETKDVPL